MIMEALGGLILFFVLAVAGIGLWARGKFKQAGALGGARDERQVLMTQAARAAGDESGREFLLLLRILDQASPGQAVTVGWHARKTARDATPGFLVKIAWDGNEWRRAMNAAEFRAKVEARLAEDPALDGPQAKQLLADVRAAEV